MIKLKDTIANILCNNRRHISKPIRKHKISPQDFEVAPYPIPPRTEPEVVDYKQYIPFVGKGSKFGRRLVADHLQELNIPGLKRMSIESEEYDERLAKENWYREKIAVPDNERNNLFKNGLRILMQSTPRDGEIRLGDADKYETFQFSYKEVPSIPNPLTSEKFEKYIYLLTHTQFLYKGSSSKRGMVPKILLHLHSINNNSTGHLRSTNSYNSLIYYFGHTKNDIMQAKELFLQMCSDNLQPNMVTLNLLLRMLETHAHIRHKVDTYIIWANLLKLIQRFGLQVDLKTWEASFLLINNNIHREVFLASMEFMNLPFSKSFIDKLIVLYCEQYRDTSQLIHDLENKCGIQWREEVSYTNLIIRHYLKSNEVEKAYKVLLDSKQKFNTKLSSFLIFFQHFAENSRKDLCFGLYFTMMKHFRTCPNILVYHYMIKSIVKSGYYDMNDSLIRIFLNDMKRKLDLRDNSVNVITKTSERWLTKARARSFLLNKSDPEKYKRLSLSDPLSETETALYKEMKRTLVWDNGIVLSPYSGGEDHLAMCWKIGIPRKNRQSAKGSSDENSIIRTVEVNKYRHIIRGKAIKNIHKYNVKVVQKGQGQALLDEMIERGMIKEAE